MENKSHALAAGAFVLLLSVMLVAMAVWLTRDHSEQRVFEIASREGVTGLQPQAGVRYKGVLVGRVTTIALDPQVRGNVLVRIAVNEQAPITASTFASLGFQGVTGLAYIALDDTGASQLALEGNAEPLARIPMRPGLVSRLTEQGGNLLVQLEQASQRINSLLAPENQQKLVGAVGNLGAAAASIGQLVQHADQILNAKSTQDGPSLARLTEQAEATLKSLQASSERLNSSLEVVRNSAAELRRTSVRMNEPDGTLDKVARSTDALVATGQSLNNSVVPRLNRATEEAARAARQVGRVAETVTENPQSLLWGRSGTQPGPGEPGFVPPPTR